MEGVGKKAKQTRSMVVKVQCSMEPPARTHHAPNEEWIARIGRLQDALAVCPTDNSARSELAALLEKLGQLEEALLNWNAVLTCDPNSLNAREGVARCRQRTRPPLQSAQ
jgi:cytochrome c-type biogenesis protein CcmH/NrfG